MRLPGDGVVAGEFDPPGNPWTIERSSVVYENPWVRMHHHDVIRPDGAPGVYGVLEVRRPAVATIALDDDLNTVLVDQWRFTRGRRMWEVPLGASSEKDGSFLASAQRELREEGKVVAAEWREMGMLDSCVGVTNDTALLFLATGLTKVDDEGAGHGADEDPDMADIRVKWVPLAEAHRMVRDGEITEVNSVVLILKAAEIYRDRLNRA